MPDKIGWLRWRPLNFNGTFTDLGTNDGPYTVSWDFGDGTAPVTGTLTPTHEFETGGTYTVTLSVTDKDGGVGTDTATVKVMNTGPQFFFSGQAGTYTTPLNAGTGTRVQGYVQLAANPTAPVNVTLTSANPAVLTLAPSNTTTAGTGSLTVTIPTNSNYVLFDLVGGPTAAEPPKLHGPTAVARDTAGNLYIADRDGYRVRKVTAAGILSTIAGTGTAGYSGDGGLATAAQFQYPMGIAVDGSGNVYIADYNDHRVRKITAATGIISTIAGTGTAGYSGDGGQATSARLYSPNGVRVAASALYIADSNNDRIRKVDLATGIITTVAGTGTAGYSGDGGLATAAQLYTPYNVALDAANNLYIADYGNQRIRKVDAATGIITTIAGTGTAGTTGDGGPATSAQIYYPTGVAVAEGGTVVYLADYYNDRIRKVDATGTITTYAGGGNKLGDEGPATEAYVNGPYSLSADTAGNLYIAAYGESRIRQIDTGGFIHTLAGTGEAGFSGDGSVATGVTLTATAGGFTDAIIPVRVGQTTWTISVATDLTTLTTTTPVTVQASIPNVGSGQRLAAATTVTLGSTNAAVLTVPTSVAIANNATSGAVTASTHNVTGTAQITAGAANGIAAGISPVVNVRGPQFFFSGQAGTYTTPLNAGTGTRVQGYVQLAANPTAPVNVTLTSANPAVLTLAPSNTTTAGTGSLTVTIPTNSNYVLFDLVGGPTAAEPPKLHGPTAVARDTAGNLYIADRDGYRVRKVTAAGILSTIAGTGTAGYSGDGGLATAAQFQYPMGIAVDGSGNVYIADYNDHRVRKITAATGIISTIAGTGTAGYSGDGGQATSARLYSPNGVRVAASALYIADSNNDRIRKVDLATGIITTVAGTGTAGYSGDGGLATAAQLYTPYNVALDAANNLYIADYGNQRIRKVDAATGIITTIAGTGTAGTTGDGGPATSAQIYYPTGVAVAEGGTVVYLADYYNDRIRKVDATGTITTYAGGGNKLGDEGPATEAYVNGPYSLSADTAGNLYIAAYGESRIRQIDTGGFIHTLAGTGEAGFSGDGSVATGVTLTATAGGFTDAIIPVRVGQTTWTISVATDLTTLTTTTPVTVQASIPNVGSGQRLAAATTVTLGSTNAAVLTVPTSVAIANNATSGAVTASTHNVTGTAQITAGAANGIAAGISPVVNVRGPQFFFSGQAGTYTTPLNAGTGTRVQGYVQLAANPTAPVNVTLTSANPAVLTLAPSNTTTAGTGSLTVTIPTNSNYVLFDLVGGPTAAEPPKLHGPTAVARDTAGNLYIADRDGYRVRKVTAAGILSTIAGTGTAGYSGDGGLATAAQFQYPMGIAVDGSGNVYIADYNDHRVRKITAATGIISTIAGTGTAGYSGDGGQATSARLYSPNGVRVAASALYIADSNNDRIRKVDLATGIITTVAGTGTAGYSGDGGLATAAQLYTPYNVALDAANNLYIADYGNQRIRKVDAATGIITTIAGTGTAGTTGDGGPATSAQIYYPTGVAVAEGGTVVYLADYYNDRIRKVDATGTITTYAGGGNKLGDEGPATEAYVNGPYSLSADTAGNLYIAAYGESRIRQIDTGGFIHTLAGTGEAGFSGDGSVATGVTLTATAGGFVTGVIPVRVNQTQFVFSGLSTTINNGVTDTFNIYINHPNIGNVRAAATTGVALTSSNTSVLADPVAVTIANNTTNVAASVTAAGPGTATLTASSPGSGINAAGSATITVP